MKCLNPIFANFIIEHDLDGNKKVLSRTIFNLKKFLYKLNKKFSSVNSKFDKFDYYYPNLKSLDINLSSWNIEDVYYSSLRVDTYVEYLNRTSLIPFKDSFISEVRVPNYEDDVAVNYSSILIPCRKCSSCILSSIREKTFRCIQEFRESGSIGCMLTLTYRDEELPYSEKFPDIPVVRYKDVQLFIKRLRKSLFGSKKGNLKYFACCEYSPVKYRPHIHIFLIGYDFGLSDMKMNPKKSHDIFRTGTSEHGKCPYYMSRKLNQLWTYGRAVISEATSSSAAYVVGYTMKKIKGRIVERAGVKECHRFSLGLGKSWFLKHYKDVVSKGFVLIDYLKSPPFKNAIPRYFINLLKKIDPLLWRQFLDKRKILKDISFSLSDLKALRSLDINLKKKFAFIDR